MSSYCATSPMSSAPWAKGDGGLEVVDHDADVVHPLDRHVASMPSVDARRHRASARARESSERPWVTCWANARRHPPDASSRTQRSPLLGADGGEEVVDRPGRIATGVTLVDHAPADVAEVAFAVHRDPDLVARPLAAFEPTLLHGDAKPHNLGLGRDTVIAIDWGDLTGFGPPAAEKPGTRRTQPAACRARPTTCSPTTRISAARKSIRPRSTSPSSAPSRSWASTCHRPSSTGGVTVSGRHSSAGTSDTRGGAWPALGYESGAVPDRHLRGRSSTTRRPALGWTARSSRWSTAMQERRWRG
jgi:hypothetical protein